jgi:hypothetical protein
LPLFILWSPILGLILSQLQSRLFTVLIVIGLTAQAIPFLLNNPLHPVWSSPHIWDMPRSRQYFLGARRLEKSYQYAVQQTLQAQCAQMGLILPSDKLEYPLWALFKQTSPGYIQIESLEVKNQSQTLLDPTFQPCVVACLQCQAADYAKYANVEVIELNSDITSPSAPAAFRLHLGQNWYPYEDYHSETFRWVNNDAEVMVTPPDSGIYRLSLEVEPGPGLASKPFTLFLQNEAGQTVAQTEVRGRETVWLMLPRLAPEQDHLFRLHIDGGGLPTPNDPRLLNFRVFWMKLVSPNDEH